MWNSLARDLYELIAPHASFEAFSKFLFEEVGRVSLDGAHDILEVVPAPALGASESVLRLRISGAIHRHLTSAAKHRYGFVSH